MKIKPAYLYACFLLLFIANCYDTRKVRYSGLNDLVFGCQSFTLYKDNSFYMEMGAGGVEGQYQISGDMVTLSYFEKPSANWPDTMFIREDYFISSNRVDTKTCLKIKRGK